ncbi:unnamed protein product [Periconia digitata]|uniref:SET domain-containing protein n=1 Tax=Periconia digitata TaxID=1303443 RepID=A0A9W4U616_9PLEO|nr:unnamed protein product [Periconia digitata]
MTIRVLPMADAKRALMYAIEDVPGKGKGLIATRNISKGTRILADKPWITINESFMTKEFRMSLIAQQLHDLNKEETKDYLSMRNIYSNSSAAKNWVGIYTTNCSTITSCKSALFPNVSRINHACNANAVDYWNDNLSKMTVHALRDLKRGEEITVCYVNRPRNRQERLRKLWEEHQFTCECDLCSQPEEKSKLTDFILDRGDDLRKEFVDNWDRNCTKNPKTLLRCAEMQSRARRLDGVNELGLMRAYEQALYVIIANGDLARASIFIGRLLFLQIVISGHDSPDTIRYSAFSRSPKQHEKYGLSDKWETTMANLPPDLKEGQKEFEDWLWRRNEIDPDPKRIDFYDRKIFPGFNDLPVECDHQSIYIKRHPRRHWCFLGEILECTMSERLDITVTDIDGEIVSISLEASADYNSFDFERGHTLGILYAERYPDLKEGVKSISAKIRPGCLKVRHMKRDWEDRSKRLTDI